MTLSCPTKEHRMRFALFKSPFMPFGRFKVFLREALTTLVVANKILDTPADQSKSFVTEKVILGERTEPNKSPH